MFFARLRKGKSSIVFRVTLWYSLFLLILLVGVLFASFSLSRSLVDQDRSKVLVEAAHSALEDLEDFEDVDDDVYFALYSNQAQLTRGRLPKGFPTSQAQSLEKVQQVSTNRRTYLYYDINVGDGQWLRAAMVTGRAEQDTPIFLTTVLLIGPVLLVLALGGGYWILKRAFAPVEQMSQTAQEIIESKDLSKRLQLADKEDELHRLGRTFNHMLETVDLAFQREQQLNNDLSHELRTPVAVILAESEYGEKYADSLAESQESFQIVHQEAARMTAMINQMLELSRASSQEVALESLDLSALLQQALPTYKTLSKEQGLTLMAEIEPVGQIAGNALLLGRLLDNLLGNALKFASSQIRLSLAQQGEELALSVWNDGPAISPADQEKIWDRFYQVSKDRNKTQHQGSGLGLSLVKTIADQHGAKVSVQSFPDQGTAFWVFFPKK